MAVATGPVTPEASMISLLAALSVLSPTTAAGLPYAKAVEASDAPVRLWMNSDRLYREGSKVRVQVDSDIEGYLLVLNYDPDGRVRVLFPLDPRDDAAVHAGRRYEVRDDDGGQAFIAGGDGTGLIYAAVAQDPWRFDEVTLNGGWDLSRREVDSRSRNPEQDLTEVVQKIAGPKGFDYDVMGYRVYGDATYSSGAYPRPIYPIYPYDDLYCNNWYWRYNGCSRYSASTSYCSRGRRTDIWDISAGDRLPRNRSRLHTPGIPSRRSRTPSDRRSSGPPRSDPVPDCETVDRSRAGSNPIRRSG